MVKTIKTKIVKENIKISKSDLEKILMKLGADYDISSLPDNSIITKYELHPDKEDGHRLVVGFTEKK